MRWRKLGRVFCAEGQFPWMASYAGVPCVEQVDGDLYRVYFTSRDAHNRSHVGWLEIEITRPDRVLRLSESPLLAPGPPGAFDDAGVTMSCLVQDGAKRYVYFIGWNLRAVPYHLSIGLALGDLGENAPTLHRCPEPILDRSPIDPLFCTAPHVRIENGHWRMWYASGLGWRQTKSGLTPSYDMRYAESENGIDWHRSGLVVLHLREDEFGISRASILRDGQDYLMWFSARGQDRPYRLGFAHSSDGITWTRDDEATRLDTSPDGWDCEMIAYPHVFDHGSTRYMLYCGNGFGRTGFGLAALA
jgi:hypothetical protein